MENLRKKCIEWLEWNDGNGIYNDVDSKNEGLQPLTVVEALELIEEQIQG